MEKIRIHVDHKKKIASEMNISLQSVRMSLDYVFNSDTSKKIRIRAKELLIEEANKIN